MTTTKPNWLQLHRRAEAAAALARIERNASREMRCKSEDTRGEQCTADFYPPEHVHQYPVDEMGDGQ